MIISDISFSVFNVLIIPPHILAFDSSFLNFHHLNIGSFVVPHEFYTKKIKPTYVPLCCGCIVDVKEKFRRGI